MKSVLYEQLVNDLRNIAATRDLSAGDVTNISDAAWLIESMQSRIAELEKDANRWIAATRDYTINDVALVRYDALGNDWVITGDDADTAIDAAMQKD